MKLISEFWKEEDAVGVVEVILILVVLIGLVLIFNLEAGTDLYVICISVSRYILYPIHGI